MARRPSKASARCTAMHAGLACKPRAMKPPRVVGPLVALRRMTGVQGEQAMGPWRAKGAGDVLYDHQFEDGAGPTLYADLGRKRNNLVVAGGSYRINSEGMIEDHMSRRRRHHARNPESTLMFLFLVGMALGVTGILNDIIQSLLPARWSQNKKFGAQLAVDALLVVGGVALHRKSMVWAIGLGGIGFVDALHATYDRLGLRDKVMALIHGTGAQGGTPPARTYASVDPLPGGGWHVTYSDGTPAADLPASTLPAPVVGGSAGIRGLGDGRQRAPGVWNRPPGIGVREAA
jgi:hypothetical protein